ncbi:MAG: DNA primase [Amaricoccus sp.]
MSLPPGFVEELLSRVPLGRIVGRKVSWDPHKSKPSKGDFWAPCPFHQEKTASFHVDDTKGYYYCFGCHAKGDAISFLRETERIGFMEAIEALAGEAGMAMPARDPVAAERAAERQGLSDALEAAIRFYRTQLAGARATAARAYLDRRGLDPALRERFEIGFSPDFRTALLEHLGPKFPRERLVEAGLIIVPDGGSPYDRFRGRIMFPIRDERGRAIAFGARAIAPDQQPKYLNSPDTPLFDKGLTLYNADRARAAAGRAGTVVVTEGYMDVIALAAAGIEHAVAPLGTAITEAQLERLWRLAPEPVVALDGDAAGLAAAQRLIDLALPLLGPDRSLRFALLPPGQDPDDVVRAGGPAAIAAILAATRPIVDLLWTRETEGHVLDSPERRAALDARLKAHLARIGDASLRAHWEREIRARRAVLFAPVRKEIPPTGAQVRPRGDRWARRAPVRSQAPSVTPSAKGSMLAGGETGAAAEARRRESTILLACLHHPEVAAEFEERLERIEFLSPNHGKIRSALLSALSGPLTESRGFLEQVALRYGGDPLPHLDPAPIRANRHLGPRATPENARKVLIEELERHEAISERSLEIEESCREVETFSVDMESTVIDPLTVRLRAATESEFNANARPLEEAGSSYEAERAEFADKVRMPEARESRRPRKR